MADKEEHVTPDEQPLDSPQEGSGSAESEPEAGQADRSKAGKPLRVKRSKAPAPAADGVGPADLIGDESGAGPGDPPPTATAPATLSVGRRERRRPGVTILNRALTAAIVVIVCFAAFEVWSSVGVLELPAPRATPAPETNGTGAPYELPAMEELLKWFEERAMVLDPNLVEESEPPVVIKQQQAARWMKKVRESFDLIGISEGEAIVVNRETGELLFLKVGHTMTVEGQALTVEKIDAEQLYLTDGTQRVPVK